VNAAFLFFFLARHLFWHSAWSLFNLHLIPPFFVLAQFCIYFAADGFLWIWTSNVLLSLAIKSHIPFSHSSMFRKSSLCLLQLEALGNFVLVRQKPWIAATTSSSSFFFFFFSYISATCFLLEERFTCPPVLLYVGSGTGYDQRDAWSGNRTRWKVTMTNDDTCVRCHEQFSPFLFYFILLDETKKADLAMEFSLKPTTNYQSSSFFRNLSSPISCIKPCFYLPFCSSGGSCFIGFTYLPHLPLPMPAFAALLACLSSQLPSLVLLAFAVLVPCSLPARCPPQTA